MRNNFASEITDLALADDRVVLLSGDIGNRLFDKYKADAGERFFNCGVAEANMMTMAAGMALQGLRPYVYTITPFVTTRCLEQIRVDVCYHEAPVTIVGTGSGFSYGALGATHHSLEDVGILRLMPGMTVVCPGDPTEVRQATRAALAHDGPVYLRIGKKGEPDVHTSQPEFAIGRGIELQPGDDLYLLSTGTVLPLAMAAARRLGEHGVSAGVVSMHTVKPLDTEMLSGIFERVPLVATVEEHSLIGGFGAAVAEWSVDVGPTDRRLLRFGTRDEFLREPGEQEYARHHMGLSEELIASGEFSMNYVTELNCPVAPLDKLRPMRTVSAVLEKLGEPLGLWELEIPPLKPSQVLVDIAFSGVCHTQLGEARGRRGDDAFLPHCLGHEASGVVAEVGSEVRKVAIGDEVIVSWIKGSGGDVPGTVYRGHDQNVNAGGATTFARQAVIAENRLTKIPAGVSMRDASYIGCAVPTGIGAVVNVAQPHPGQSLAVFGTGGVGLCAVAGAVLTGCAPIIAIDRIDTKLETAKRMGAHHTINVDSADLAEELSRLVPGGLDFAIEATGVGSVMVQALSSVRQQGGAAVVIGNARFGDHIEINPREFNAGKRLLGTWGGDSVPDRDYPRYANLLRNGRLDLSELQHDVYPLEEINRALDDLEAGRAIRPLIDMSLDAK